jgi:hypothetical protein
LPSFFVDWAPQSWRRPRWCLHAEQALLGQVRVDLVGQRLGQVVGQQQSPEREQRGGIWLRIARQVDAHEVAQGLAVIQRAFQRLVGQALPLLQAVHAQTCGELHRLASDPSLVGYRGSITAIKRAQGTTRSISARNFSRRVRFFFIAYSALAKLR